MIFTQDEIEIMGIYNVTGKTELEKQLRFSVPFIENEELKVITAELLNKLHNMSEAEFKNTELTPLFTADDAETDIYEQDR